MTCHQPDSPTADIARQLQGLTRSIPVCSALRFDIRELADGRCRMAVPKPAQFDGINGVFHGGLLATVADSVAWFAIATRRGPDTRLTTSDLHIRFLAPCWTGVTAKARVIKFGRTLCPVEVELFDESGRLVAFALVTYFVMDSAPRPQEPS
jgi:uncharacterized protein (TIGR00369 family)